MRAFQVSESFVQHACKKLEIAQTLKERSQADQQALLGIATIRYAERSLAAKGLTNSYSTIRTVPSASAVKWT